MGGTGHDLHYSSPKGFEMYGGSYIIFPGDSSQSS